ncbi:MAG: hypothetical protein ACXIVG_03340 [Pararhodobacter sp.]
MVMLLDSLHAGHVLAFLVYGGMIGVLRGRIGQGAGLRDLFHDKPAHAALFDTSGSPARWQIWLSPGFTTMALFTLWIGVTLALLGWPPRVLTPHVGGAAASALAWGGVAALIVLSLIALLMGRPPALHEVAGAQQRRLAGMVAGLVVAVVLAAGVLPVLESMVHRLDWLSPWWQQRLTGFLPLLLALMALIAAARLWVQAGAACVMLLIVLTTGFAALAQVPVLLLLGMAILGAVWLVSRLVPFRYRIPGIPARYYDSPVDPGAPAAEPDLAAPLVAPEQALKAWHQRQAGQGLPAASEAGTTEKPRLVLLALSGGGYRATFWAAAVLDALFQRDSGFQRACGGDTPVDGDTLDGLAGSIRFIAGASGGMVTGGYLAHVSAQAAAGAPVPPSLVGMIEDDILAYQTQERRIAPPDMVPPPRRRVPLARDSLSAIAWQLLADLGHIFRTGTVQRDRGRILQAHWSTLDAPFSQLRDAEAKGMRPSVIYSPMLIENGAPFFISNLDLASFRTHYVRNGQSDANEHSDELFRLLPGAFAEAGTGLTVATAARLSATFPYVLPAVSLPLKGYRRVVDAGYYDNYGIDVLAGLLNTDAVRDWVVRHCSGVLVIALRAFPDTAPNRPDRPVARLFWWLTSPVEAMFNARGSSQTFRNREQLRLTRQLYGAALVAAEKGPVQPRSGPSPDDRTWQQRGRDFVDIVTFTCDAEASMSWHLSQADMDRLDAGAQDITDPEKNPDMRRLLTLWNGPPVRKPPQA